MKLKIKKGDTVEVTTGQDKGRKGSVLHINKDKLKVKVQGIRIQTHFDKKEGIQKKEGFIDYSNIKLIEKNTSKNTSKNKK